MFCFFAILVFQACFVSAEVSPTATYANSLILDKPDNYYLYWNYTSDTFIAEVHAKTYGWVSFGITVNGKLDNSDLMVAWLNDENTIKFADCHIKNNEVFVDLKQNWNYTNVTQAYGYTIVKFSRKITLCDVDSDEDLNIETGTPYVSYAWGALDPTYKFIRYFLANRGIRPVPLISASQKGAAPSSIYTQTFSMTASLTNDEYISFKCRIFNFNNSWSADISTTKRHLYKYQSILSTTDYLVEWVMYECTSSFNSSAYTLTNSATCSLQDDNDWATVLKNECQKIVLVWHQGSLETQEFPFNVGMPFGGSGASRFYIVRLHYINPYLVRDVSHTISLVLTYTSTLRSLEAGTFSVGAKNSITGMVVPPGASEVTVNAYCTAACTNAMLPSFSVLYVFGSTPHVYSLGTQVYSKLIRSGAEQAYLYRNKYFNNSYQYTQFTDNPVAIKRGDQIVTTCKYNTKEQNMFFYGPDEETCLTVLYYYPRDAAISYCYSQPTVNAWVTLLRGFNDSGKIYEQSLSINTSTTDLDYAKAINVISQIAVDDSVRQSFQSFYENANQTQFCGYNSGVSTITPINVRATLSDPAQCRLSNVASKLSIKATLLSFFLVTVFYLELSFISC